MPSVHLSHQMLLSRVEIGRSMADDIVHHLIESSASEGSLGTFLSPLCILCMADVACLLPQQDPCRFICVLKPYLLSAIEETSVYLVPDLNDLLEIFALLLPPLKTHLWHELVLDLRKVFYHLVTKQKHVNIISAACRCLCLLANANHQVGEFLRTLAVTYRDYLQRKWQSIEKDQPLDTSVYRVLFVLGHICRHSSHILESEAGERKTSETGLESYVHLFLQIFESVPSGCSSLSAGRACCLIGCGCRDRSRIGTGVHLYVVRIASCVSHEVCAD